MKLELFLDRLERLLNLRVIRDMKFLGVYSCEHLRYQRLNIEAR